MSQQKADSQPSEDTTTPKQGMKSQRGEPDEDYGYYYYPERGDEYEQKTFFGTMLEGRKGNKIKCLTNVVSCMRNGEYSQFGTLYFHWYFCTYYCINNM